MTDDAKETGSAEEAAEAPDPAAGTRVFLVVVDETTEMQLALRYACLRARKTGGKVALLYVIEPSGFQHWMSVGELMRAEARSEGEQLLQKLAAQVNEEAGTMPILYVREGETRDQLLHLIEEEPSISILVLGASTSSRGPGPLVSALTGKYIGKLRVPITLVPDSISDDDLEAIT